MGYPGFGDDEPDMAPIWKAQEQDSLCGCTCNRNKKSVDGDRRGFMEILEAWEKSMDEWDRKVAELNTKEESSE